VTRRDKPHGKQPAHASPPAHTAGAKARPAEPLVLIALNQMQVNHVVKAAAGVENISHRLANVDKSFFLDRKRPQLKDRTLSMSLLTGLLIYDAFPTNGNTLGVNELAAAIKASPSTTHRYLTTLVAVGLLQQNADTRRYQLAHTPAIRDER